MSPSGTLPVKYSWSRGEKKGEGALNMGRPVLRDCIE